MKKKQMPSFSFVSVLLLSLTVTVVSMETVSAAVFSFGLDPPTSPPPWGAVRYKNFYSGSGGEIYLGKPDLGVGGNRVETEAVWQSSNHIIFTYDPTTLEETTTVQTGINNYSLDYSFLSDAGPLNYFHINVVNRTAGTTVDFNNVTLNGAPLCGPPCNFTAAVDEWNKWLVTSVDLTAGFTLEGDIVLTGTQPSNEMNKVEISFGYVPPLTITTDSLPDGWFDIPYNAFVYADGGIPPYSWTGSGLPDGLNINNSTGEISGTPTTTGPSSPNIQVTDEVPSLASKNFSIQISSHPARISSTHEYFSYIQSAYDACHDDTIESQVWEFTENVECDDIIGKSVTLKGGFNSTFTDIIGYTTINGQLTISHGTVVVDRIIIQ